MKNCSSSSLFLYLFIGIFVVVFFFMGYHRIWDAGPQSIHAWRQSDSYAQALTFYHEDLSLWEPHLLFTGENGDRQAISEFPILYWLTAKIWKITGPHPAVLRLIDLLLLWLGLFFLARLIYEMTNDWYWSSFTALLTFSSPVLGYYSFNFIPNVPAFGLSLIGLYFLFRFHRYDENTDLAIATALYILASLIKVTALFSLLALSGSLILVYSRPKTANRRKILKIVASLFIVLAVYLVWNRYAHSYNQQHLNGLFNQSIIPIWELIPSQISEIANKAYHHILPQYFYPPAYYIIILLFVFLAFNFKKIDKVWINATLLLFAGIGLFKILFFQGLDEHDYFLTNTLMFIPFVSICMFDFFRKKKLNLNSPYIKIPASFMLIFLLNYSMIVTRSHYNPHQKAVTRNIHLSKAKQDYWAYVYWTLELQDFQYRGINDYMREIGITYNDLVISLGDYSPNRTLCWMETKGFTDYYSSHLPLPERIEKLKAMGAKYLVYNENDKIDLTNVDLGPQIGQYNKIQIYRIAR
ncbi:ArnT family glycosyltransferase [Mangrovibacterium diazotrophicum]|uniref:Dolichyl-phosphate-mannose-protein mannosyltransferase n=1 Tax=Mangrovibacterium diazotrophicum TaxID=1261403 RepID=A0A419W7E0_9BACT|nr:glycosyltransferase family 39 protein [Mangrovibacterium diazotrophicum]RKD91379.1 dolichyl-phosphate-mannose-protein mannosyltransferase [Mangrovibacterium diazotrophicum]